MWCRKASRAIGRKASVLLALIPIAGCAMHSARDVKIMTGGTRASFDLAEPRGKEDVLLIVALSGGGSRAAYFSAAVMERLQHAFPEVDLLKEVDVLSSVSGGSLAAAYYAVSKDPDASVAIEMPYAPNAELPKPKFDYDTERRRLTVRGVMTPDDLAVLHRAFPAEANERIARIERLSRADAGARHTWDAASVKALMKKNYLGKWLLRWFYPWNVVRYWFTSYSRTDIMAGVFADELYGTGFARRKLTFSDLNPERPYLVLNATNATRSGGARQKVFDTFTFTEQDFATQQVQPELGGFNVSGGVMTSAAFPAVFNYVNLPDRTPQHGYVHLFDGGNADNLGLASADRVIWENWKREKQFRRIAVIVIDAYTAPAGVSPKTADPRWPWGYFIDTNFLDTFDALLTANRKNMLAWFDGKLHTAYMQKQPRLCHLTWEPGDSPAPPHTNEAELGRLRPKLNRIPTSFTLSDKHARRLDRAAELLVSEQNECLRDVRAMFQSGDATDQR